MGQNSITMFTNDSGSASSPQAYVQDAFQDVTDTPSNNSGWSSTISTNPMNNIYGNDDFPRFGPKTLWIKDLVLESNRSLWINGEPTYRIIWSEPFPSAQGYVFGNIQLVRNFNQTFVRVRSVGDGFGVGGVFARAMFLMIGNTAAATSATGAVSVDGIVNATTVDWSNLAGANPAVNPMYAASVHAGTNETYNIHDFRLTAIQAGTVFNIAGVVVYSENSSLNIDQFPGTTYNNKNQSITTGNSAILLPTFGTSIGGRSTIWKTLNSGYSMSTIGVSTITSLATGTNGTNILNVTPGQGSSFSAGYGVISAFGSSFYVGVIQSISTDALTVYPTLPFGISNSIYRYFQSGQSLAMNASLNILAYTFGSTEMLKPGAGFTSPFLDPLQNFAVWGTNFGVTVIDNNMNSLAFATAAGFLQCEGYFSAAEIEWSGQSWGILSGTMIVNGLPVYNHSNIGFTGVMKKTVFIEAGPGWNNFAFFPGSSHINVGISRINMYTRNRDISASFGVLAAFDTLQAYVPRGNNATAIAPGVFKRTFADQLNIGASFLRGVGSTHAGGVGYNSNTAGASFVFQYYGTHFSVIGGSYLAIAGGSLNILVDGVSTYGFTHLNRVIQCASLTFHKLQINILGGTNIISAIDFFRPFGEMKNLQTFSAQPIPSIPKIPIISEWFAYTPTVTNIPTSTNSGNWRRVGDSMEIQTYLQASNSGSGTISISIPQGYSIDTTKLSVGNAIVGIMRANHAGGVYECAATVTSNAVQGSGGGGGGGDWNATTPFTWANNDTLQAFVTVPILGWGAST